MRAYDREQKFADVVRGTDGRFFFVLVEVVAIDPIHNVRLLFSQSLGSEVGKSVRRGNLLHHDSHPMGIEFFAQRSEEHTSELQSLMRHSYAVFCLTHKKFIYTNQYKSVTTQQ